MFPARMSPPRNAPGRSARVRNARFWVSAAGADRGKAGGALVARVLLVTATAALSTLAVWFVGAGASASGSEITADAEEIVASPVGAIDGGADIDRGGDEVPDPIAAAVNGLDETAADAGATSGKAAPGPSAPLVEATSVGPETPPDRGAGLTERIPTERAPEEHAAVEQDPTEQVPDELVGRPVEHVLHQARPALEPVARTAGAVGDAVGGAAVGSGAASDDPVSAAFPEIRGDDVANFLSPLWTEEGAALPPPDANPPSSGEKAEPPAEAARVETAATPPHGAPHDQLRPDHRSAKVAPTGEVPGNFRDARGTPANPDAPVIDALDAHPKTGHNAAGAVTDGGNQAGFAVGWYPVATPLDGSSPSKRIPDEDRVRSGTSAPQPGTTPD